MLLGNSATDSSRHTISARRIFHADYGELLHAHVFGNESTAHATAPVQERIHFGPLRRPDLLHRQYSVLRKCLSINHFNMGRYVDRADNVRRQQYYLLFIDTNYHTE